MAWVLSCRGDATCGLNGFDSVVANFALTAGHIWRKQHSALFKRIATLFIINKVHNIDSNKHVRIGLTKNSFEANFK